MDNLERMIPDSTETFRFNKEHYDKVLEARKKLPWFHKEYVDRWFEFNRKFTYTKKN